MSREARDVVCNTRTGRWVLADGRVGRGVRAGRLRGSRACPAKTAKEPAKPKKPAKTAKKPAQPAKTAAKALEALAADVSVVLRDVRAGRLGRHYPGWTTAKPGDDGGRLDGFRYYRMYEFETSTSSFVEVIIRVEDSIIRTKDDVEIKVSVTKRRRGFGKLVGDVVYDTTHGALWKHGDTRQAKRILDAILRSAKKPAQPAKTWALEALAADASVVLRDVRAGRLGLQYPGWTTAKPGDDGGRLDGFRYFREYEFETSTTSFVDVVISVTGKHGIVIEVNAFKRGQGDMVVGFDMVVWFDVTKSASFRKHGDTRQAKRILDAILRSAPRV